jgi:hypothetical protein
MRFEVDHTRLKLVSSIVLMDGKKLRMSKVGRQKLAELEMDSCRDGEIRCPLGSCPRSAAGV